MRMSKLLPPDAQSEYGVMLLAWTLQAVDYFADDNWEQVKGQWFCRFTVPWPGAIHYRHPGRLLRFDFAAMRESLHGSYSPPDALRQTRRRMFDCVSLLMGQADPSSRKAFKQLRKEVSA